MEWSLVVSNSMQLILPVEWSLVVSYSMQLILPVDCMVITITPLISSHTLIRP